MMDANERSAGSLFLAGGGLQDGNDPLWQEFYVAAQKAVRQRASTGDRIQRKPVIAVFCSAAANWAEAEAIYEVDGSDGRLGYRSLFERIGFEPFLVPVSQDRPGYCDSSMLERLRDADAFWFNGGNQAHHAAALLRGDGQDSAPLQAVREAHARGAVIGGTSAGTMIQGTWTFGEGTAAGYVKQGKLAETAIGSPSLQPPNDPEGGGFMPGFRFLTGIDAVADTHFSEWSRFGRLPVVLGSLAVRYGIGVDENTALLLTDGIGRVVGEGGVMIYDARVARFRSHPFHADGILLHWLTAGDRFDFGSGTAHSDKALLHATSHYQATTDGGNPLLSRNAVRMMTELASNNAAAVESRYDGLSISMTRSNNGWIASEGSQAAISGITLRLASSD